MGRKIFSNEFWPFYLTTIILLANSKLSNAQNDVPPLEPAEQRQSQIIPPAKAFAAPINRQQGNSVALNGEHKPFFKIHYRDGIQKAIFDETPRRVPPDFEDNNDVGIGGGREFDAYEDTKLVDPRNEVPLFIPFLYRNESEEEQQQTQPPPQQIRTNRPLVAPEVLQSRQPVIVRTTTPIPFGRPIRPAQPFARPQPPPPPSAPQFPPQRPPQQQPFLPQQPIPPLPQRPPPPPPPPQQFRPQQPPPQIPPQQPRFPPQLPPQPFQQPQIPPRPPQPPPPPSPPQPQLPRPSQPSNNGNLRSGICHQTIFYTPQPVNAFDVQRIYTHFAMVVSVDQCARTCHEFNCDVAILDPRTRHCQFNPSTAFRLAPTCPQWPNPLFRNNFQFTDELIKIQCVTCQQRRRGHRPPGAQQLPASLPPFGPSQQQQSVNLRRPSQPQFVLRTTTRERIGNVDLNGNNLNASPIQRVANAAKTQSFTSIENNENGQNNNEGEEQRNLSEEFHKLERLLKSAEDYLDETGNRGRGHRHRHNGKGREVPSWRDGHPQGDGHSPLKINPLRSRPPPYYADSIRFSPIFYSTDILQRKAEEDEDLVEKGRKQRETGPTNDGEEHQNENGEGPSLAPLNGKPKVNSAGSVKLQAQEPAGLRELATEGKSTTN